MRWITKLCVGLFALLIVGCAADAVSPPAVTPTATARPTVHPQPATPIALPTPDLEDGVVHITVGDNYFDPPNVIVKIGTKVEWWHGGALSHTIAGVKGDWGPIYPTFGGRYQLSFNTVGVYAYTCTLHSGMDATITVID